MLVATIELKQSHGFFLVIDHMLMSNITLKQEYYFSGNVGAKCRRGAGFSPHQSYTEGQIALKGCSFMEAAFSDSKNLSARPPNHSGKIKLQLFPIDEAIQKVLQQASTSVFARASYKYYIQSFFKFPSRVCMAYCSV